MEIGGKGLERKNGREGGRERKITSVALVLQTVFSGQSESDN